MEERVRGKLNSASGVSRFVVILAVLVLVLAIVVIIPFVAPYGESAERIACVTAMDTATREMTYEAVSLSRRISEDEGRGVVTAFNLGLDTICPSGGETYYIVDEDATLGMRVVCGLHDDDHKRRARLNAGHVLDELRESLSAALRKGEEVPESITVRLNGRDLKCVLVNEAPDIRRGTDTTTGYDGTVAFYSVVGVSDFGKDSGMEEGKIWYFSFADEEYFVNWSSRNGWTGTAYD